MKQITLKKILIVTSLLVLLFVVFAQFKDFKQSIEAIRNARVLMLILSVVFSLFTYVAAAMVYKMLAIKPLPFARTLLVQLASNFTNRLLPAGAGSLATFARNLVKQEHSKQQATALVTINNILGFFAITLLTLVVAVVSQTPLSHAFKVHLTSFMLLVGILVFLIFTLILVVFGGLRAKVKKLQKGIIKDFKLIATKPSRLFGALAYSVLISVSYAAVLYVSIKALNESATILQTIGVLTVGVAAASITPTPGGIGGAEAGLVAGLNTIGIAPETGLSIALVYRFATFWLPILPGFIAFQIALKRKVL